MLFTVEGEISKSLPIFLWGTLFFKHFNNFLTYLLANWRSSATSLLLRTRLSWMLLLYQIIMTITCWHQLFQITSLFNQFTSLLALNCSCPNFFWNVLQVWMTGKDVYLQMTWSWPDKTWNIVCNEIQVKVNLEITTFFFYLRFPYCPNFFWFGVVHELCSHRCCHRFSRAFFCSKEGGGPILLSI